MGIDRRSGVGGRETGDRQEEWGGRWRVGIDRSRVGGRETVNRQEECGGRGIVGIDRRSGVGGGEWG